MKISSTRLEAICLCFITFTTLAKVGNSLGECPHVCSCYGTRVDCTNRDLQEIPSGIPEDVERL